jgi:hypothetical protein
MPKLAVGYYGFALGRLGSGVSSTFAQSGFTILITPIEALKIFVSNDLKQNKTFCIGLRR